MNDEVNVPEEFLELIPEIPASEQEPGEPSRETYALAVYVFEQVLKTGAGEATAVMAAIDNVLKPIRSQEHQRVREALEAEITRLETDSPEAPMPPYVRVLRLTKAQGFREALHTLEDPAQQVTVHKDNEVQSFEEAEREMEAALSEGVGSGPAVDRNAQVVEAARRLVAVYGREYAEEDEQGVGTQAGLDALVEAVDAPAGNPPCACGSPFSRHVDGACPPPQAVQGEAAQIRCRGTGEVDWTFGNPSPKVPCPGCPDCQPEKGGEG